MYDAFKALVYTGWYFGEHSQVMLSSTNAAIVLMRKNMASPSSLERFCCCASSGVELCAVHLLHKIRSITTGERVFNLSSGTCTRRTRQYASMSGVAEAENLGGHAFRRGMAQDIIGQGGSLAALLCPRGWHSKAFLKYLMKNQCENMAIDEMVIILSDSDAEA